MSVATESREVHFAVEDWAALASGLSTKRQWQDWFARPERIAREFTADLSWVPAGLRRRVGPLGRAALSVLASCHSSEPCPIVFASSYGDLESIAELLTQLHQEAVVSPMGFSLSVHNAPVGIYSIARADRTTTTSIAARSDLAEAAFVEALGWIAEGAVRVLVVCCEDPVPSAYRADSEGQGFRYAWACRLRAESPGGIGLTTAEDQLHEVPIHFRVDHPCLRVLSFLTDESASSLSSESGRYRWRRHA